MNYCSECGFKLDGDFKFCPNCGSKVETEIKSISERQKNFTKSLLCKNCGEENPIENSVCFSCGVPLSGNKSKKEQGHKTDSKKKSVLVNDSGKREINSSEKVLDNKKILIISAVIFVVFIFALVASGVFDTGIQTETTQVDNSSTITNSSSVDLSKIAEINDLEEKIKANPEDLESALHLAHLQQDAGLSEKAISNYKKYLAKFPEDADARVDMAICYYNLNDYNTAISEMETAIKYQPKHQIAYLNLGIVNLTAKNIEASKEWFKKTVELDPNSEAGKRAAELMHSH